MVRKDLENHGQPNTLKPHKARCHSSEYNVQVPQQEIINPVSTFEWHGSNAILLIRQTPMSW